jgi:hypothetical protein
MFYKRFALCGFTGTNNRELAFFGRDFPFNYIKEMGKALAVDPLMPYIEIFIVDCETGEVLWESNENLGEEP